MKFIKSAVLSSDSTKITWHFDNDAIRDWLTYRLSRDLAELIVSGKPINIINVSPITEKAFKELYDMIIVEKVKPERETK